MYLEKNLRAIAKRYPQYVQPIMNAPITGRYAITPTANSVAPNFMDKRMNAMYYNNVDPIYAIDKALEERDFQAPYLSMYIGFGLGYDMLVYSRKFVNRAYGYIIFENDWEILKIAFTNFDYADMLSWGGTCLCFGPDTSYFYNNMFNLLVTGQCSQYLKAINMIETGTAFTTNREYYAACMQIVRQASVGAMNLYGNSPEDSLWGIRHTFLNIDEIINNPGIKDLKDAFKNKPGIVVSTGPSLDKNIHLLEEVIGKAVIAAPDASMRVMKKHGYKPHFVTCLERVEAIAKHFDGLEDEDYADVYFAACPVIHPVGYEANKSERIIAYRDFATFKWIGIDRGQFAIGPSAGNMAYKILEYMGCNPIILIGQDLAYVGEQTHAEGTGYGTKQVSQAAWGTLEVEGNYVPSIKTTAIWDMFRKYYERDIAAFKGTVINATEGGAKILGTQIMSFREAIDKYINKPVDALLVAKKRLKIPFPAQREKDRKLILKKVKEALAYTQRIISDFQKGGECTNELLNEYLLSLDTMEDRKEIQKIFNKCYNDLAKYYKIMEEEQFYLIYMHYVQSYLIKMRNDINGEVAGNRDTKEAFVRMLHMNFEFFTNMIKLVLVMEKELMDLNAHLEANNK